MINKKFRPLYGSFPFILIMCIACFVLITLYEKILPSHKILLLICILGSLIMAIMFYCCFIKVEKNFITIKFTTISSNKKAHGIFKKQVLDIKSIWGIDFPSNKSKTRITLIMKQGYTIDFDVHLFPSKTIILELFNNIREQIIHQN